MWDLSTSTRDGTCTPCIGKQSLNPWTAREIPSVGFEHWGRERASPYNLLSKQTLLRGEKKKQQWDSRTMGINWLSWANGNIHPMERGLTLDSNVVWYLRTMPGEFQIRGTSLKLSLWVVWAFSSLFLDFAHSCPIGSDLTFRLSISSKWIFQYFTVLNYLNSKYRVQKEHDKNTWQTFFSKSYYKIK